MLVLLPLLALLPYLVLGRMEPIDFSGAKHQSHETLSSRRTDKDTDPFLGVQYHSGYINVGEQGGQMFYWYFPRKNSTTSQSSPFAIWLTGGQEIYSGP